MLVSIIIRTLNEEKYLDKLLSVISSQSLDNFTYEVVIIDSGSVDKTLEIATAYKARITHIDKQKFTFGRSLNMGCEFSDGDFLVFISGHCIPTDNNWLTNLVKPLMQKKCIYAYGKQVGRDTTKFSEMQVFKKYFPSESSIPQAGYFCNNANAAISREAWSRHQFNEELTGLEDMFLAKLIYQNDGAIGYVANSVVYHIHNESWQQVKIRYERESIALKKIMPEINISFIDMLHFLFAAIFQDARASITKKVFFKELRGIILFRTFQYYGAFKGNHMTRKLSRELKINYFYPK
jgi:rhamnosyltransferase